MKKRYTIFFLMPSEDKDIIPLEIAFDTIEEAEAEIERMIAKDIVHDWTYLIIPQYSKK